ncbi:lycopene cyclase, partial [Mycobacterium tuberculosis]|nr:lycopene cyclase [Mycobacterium tuberculosis]
TERRRFLRHALAFWDVHRHRLAPAAARRLERLLAAGQAECRAARVVGLRRLADGVEVTLRPRGGGDLETRVVGAVVNCT